MKVFKLFCLLGFIFIFQSAVHSADLTFTTISDAGIKSDRIENSMTPSIKKLLSAKDNINHSGSKFVVFLGNNIAKAEKYDLVLFSKIINKISKPVYAGIGNQDIQRVKDLDKIEYYRLLNKYSKNKVSKIPCVKKIDGFVFIFMDGINETVPMPKGYFKDKELIFLENTLKKYMDKDVIIIQHFPLYNGKEENGTLYNAEPYKNLLSQYKNVKAIISGHTNSDFEGEDENRIKHISVPSLAKSGEYKVINIKTTGETVSIKTKIISVE